VEEEAMTDDLVKRLERRWYDLLANDAAIRIRELEEIVLAQRLQITSLEKELIHLEDEIHERGYADTAYGW
jgi:hypothetical protein